MAEAKAGVGSGSVAIALVLLGATIRALAARWWRKQQGRLVDWAIAMIGIHCSCNRGAVLIRLRRSSDWRWCFGGAQTT